MDIEEKISLITRKPVIETLTEDLLRHYLEQGVPLQHYIGYEISGYIHLGSALGALKIVDFQEAGAKTRVFLADWHAWINNKLGGDIDTIRRVAKGYFTHAMKKVIEAFGGDPDKTEFVLASDIYDDDYWALVLKIGKEVNLSRALRSITIMGRKSKESVPTSWLIYPLMQAADIFYQGVNLAHAGIDQRKIHVITIEIGEKLAGYKPVAVHHHLITNLALPWDVYKKIKEGGNLKEAKEELSELKMSKSIPGSTFFVHDSEEKIRETIRKAFCPHGETELNPIWEIVEYVIFRDQKVEFTITNEKTGEERTYYTVDELREDWINKKIHPLDLKSAVADWLVKTFEPVRKYFEGPGKKYLEEMENIKITR